MRKYCKRRKIMRDFVRELYESEISETSRVHRLSETGNRSLNVQENICTKLKNTLKDKDLELFENYLNEGVIVRSEELFYAYCSGMRDFIRLCASLFDEH